MNDPDPTPPFAAAVEAFVDGSGARSAVLLDKSGGVLAEAGFGDGAHLADIAALVCGFYASGRRIGVLSGSGAPRGAITLGAGRIEVRAIDGARGTLLLFSVFDRPGSGVAIAGAIDDLGRTLDQPGRDHAYGGLEDSLLDRLDQVFPVS